MVEQGHSIDLFARSSYIDKPWFSVYEHTRVCGLSVCLLCPLRGLDALTNSFMAALLASQ